MLNAVIHGAPVARPSGEIHAPLGTHFWVVAAVWQVNPEDQPRGWPLRLDRANLVGLDGPGCYLCEQEYTRRAADRPCPGEPRA